MMQSGTKMESHVAPALVEDDKDEMASSLEGTSSFSTSSQSHGSLWRRPQGRTWAELLGSSNNIPEKNGPSTLYPFAALAVRRTIELFLARVFRQANGHAEQTPRYMLGVIVGVVSAYNKGSQLIPSAVMETILLLAHWDFSIGRPTHEIDQELTVANAKVYKSILEDDRVTFQESLESLNTLRKERLKVYDACIAACEQTNGILDALSHPNDHDLLETAFLRADAQGALRTERQDMATAVIRDYALLKQNRGKQTGTGAAVVVKEEEQQEKEDEQEVWCGASGSRRGGCRRRRRTRRKKKHGSV